MSQQEPRRRPDPCRQVWLLCPLSAECLEPPPNNNARRWSALGLSYQNFDQETVAWSLSLVRSIMPSLAPWTAKWSSQMRLEPRPAIESVVPPPSTVKFRMMTFSALNVMPSVRVAFLSTPTM